MALATEEITKGIVQNNAFQPLQKFSKPEKNPEEA